MPAAASTPVARTSTASRTGTGKLSSAKAPPPKAKAARKLPSLPASFDSASRAHDDPKAHQGRKRARPFVDGDYYAHVYVALDVSPELGRAIDAVVSEATAHSLVSEPSSSSTSSTTPPSTSSSTDKTKTYRQLHVSLSHPLPLRRDMVSSFAPAVRRALSGTGGFRLSLAGAPVVYYNAPGGAARMPGRGLPRVGGRAFLGLRVGAGTKELAALLERLEDVLKRLHLPLYHDEPEFHASFAWALCTLPDGGGREDDEDEKDVLSPFPPDLVGRLAEHTDAALAVHPGWNVQVLCVKVAKDVVRIPL